MINTKNPKVQEMMQEMHEAVQRKVKRGANTKEAIVMENQLFSVLCGKIDLTPTECAEDMNRKYGYDLTGNEIIEIFRNRRMANPYDRKELFMWAAEVADYFAKAMSGNRAAFEKFEKRRKDSAFKTGRKHDSQERIMVLMIYERYSELDAFGDVTSLNVLGNTLSRYLSFDIADALCEVYGFPQYRERRKKEQSQKPEKKLTYEQAMRRIEQLETRLERSNTMLQDLQDEFEEQLESSKVKELADFFARLNSEKYGCILDELLVVRKGVDELRKSSEFELPIQINGLLIMIKKLIQFVRDSHIEPIMKIDSLKEVQASDVEFCNYDGTPFVSAKEKKTVRVISPGWVYKDKEVQISRPKVKEENV